MQPALAEPRSYEVTSTRSATIVTVASDAKACCSRIRDMTRAVSSQATTEDEGQDPEAEPDRRQMLEQRPTHAVRKQISLGRDRVSPERTRQPAGGEQGERRNDQGCVRERELSMRGDRIPNGGARPARERTGPGEDKVMDEQHRREDDDQDGELGPRERRHDRARRPAARSLRARRRQRRRVAAQAPPRERPDTQPPRSSGTRRARSRECTRSAPRRSTTAECSA